ncbi:uncharacterized protein METZ01_LOCUS491652 [marine metagenome]|uniref:Imelysin-like domain-containing protein n=1 Tax=marine metagenome TaxID=408172 RepID=A0A383D4K0_9ZZZZ
MKKIVISLFSILILTTNTSFADKEIQPYSKDTCQEIYNAIGTFLVLADINWKEKNEEKALFYSSASANYATIYETVCKD